MPGDAGEDHPLVELARHRALPTMVVDSRRPRGVRAASTPMLWTDFQLDVEHRLPDDRHVPGLRDLLHRGSLLRERTVHERLPELWRKRLDAELRALYAWHVSPLLRRVSALVQTVDAVSGAHVEAPFRDLHSVAGYLLGLTERRPVEALFSLVDPVESARSLAIALQSFDRRLHVRAEERAWNGLHARLATWSEAGLLARCGGDEDGRAFEFCFSGTPLAQRAATHRGPDGIARLDLDVEDRRTLGWFRLECRIVADRVATEPAPVVSTAHEPSVVDLGLDVRQLDLGLGDDAFPYRENTA